MQKATARQQEAKVIPPANEYRIMKFNIHISKLWYDNLNINFIYAIKTVNLYTMYSNETDTT